ncbi:AmmeMemoRadiSam system protein B [bacterium]|nr:AmmeMemoRadiSam system protein B [bacterium]
MFENIKTYPLETPALRPLELMPVEVRGQRLIMVRDPLGVIEGTALLAPDPILMVLFEMANGETPVGEMAQRLTMMTGQIIPAGIFESAIKQLDEALLLQSDRFAAALKAKYEAWNAATTRPYRIYQAPGADRLKMMKELGEEFRRHKMSAISPPENLELAKGAVVGVVSPHIDFQRGGELYAWAYKALKEYGTGAKTFIVLGTSHRSGTHRFVATRKNYDTPLGAIDTDQAILDELATEFGGELFENEFLHRDEHTIELQAMYLRHTFPDTPIRMVPILVPSFDDLLDEEGTPRADEEITAFVAALRRILDKHGDNVAVIAGVDLSHCGPEFGDEEPNTPERQKEIRLGDELSLEKAVALDADGFFETFRPDFNSRKVCSIGTVWVMLEVMKGRAEGKLLKYNQAVSPDQNTLVSFAAMAFSKVGAEVKPPSRIILLR